MTWRLQHPVGKVLAPASVALVLAMLSMGVSSASAAQEPVWKVIAVPSPTNFTPGDESGGDSFLIEVTNVGSVSSDGSAITISDSLPAGLTAKEIFGNDMYKKPSGSPEANELNSGGGVSCSVSPVANCTTSNVVDQEIRYSSLS